MRAAWVPVATIFWCWPKPTSNGSSIRSHKVKPAVVIVDSIQMIYKPQIPAAPGSVTQLRDCCMDLVYLAKATGVAVIVVGHVTKAGTLAGPKIIEHIVDTVVYFEGDRYHAAPHRALREKPVRIDT